MDDNIYENHAFDQPQAGRATVTTTGNSVDLRNDRKNSKPKMRWILPAGILFIFAACLTAGIFFSWQTKSNLLQLQHAIKTLEEIAEMQVSKDEWQQLMILRESKRNQTNNRNETVTQLPSVNAWHDIANRNESLNEKAMEIMSTLRRRFGGDKSRQPETVTQMTPVNIWHEIASEYDRLKIKAMEMMTFREEIGPELEQIDWLIRIRLVGGGNSSQGRVEVARGDMWGTVCDDEWDINDANVVCRMLGFPRATEAPHRARFGEGTGEVWLDDVNCTGREVHIGSCPSLGWGKDDCGHREDASVVCAP